MVSEETGRISLAHGGTLERGLSTEQLQRRLTELVPRYVPSMTVSGDGVAGFTTTNRFPETRP